MAEGLSNRGLGRRLFLSERTVETHVNKIFTKLDLPRAPTTIGASWPSSDTSPRADAGTQAESGFDVVGEAADAAAALLAARDLEPDIVRLDIQLPDSDGFAVAQALS